MDLPLRLCSSDPQTAFTGSAPQSLKFGSQRSIGPEVGSTLNRLLETAPDAIVGLDAEGRIALVNARFEHWFGYAREEVLGRPVEILVPERFRGAHLGHRRRYAAAPHTRPMGAGLDLYAQRKDGTEFPVEISLSPTDDVEGIHVTAILRDVSERRQAEERAGTILGRIAEAVLILGADGSPAQVTPAAAAILERLPEGLRNAVTAGGSPLPDAELPGEVTRLTGREIDEQVLGFRARDGSVRWLRLSSRRLVDGPPPHAVVVSFTDVTEQRATAERLHETQERYRAVVSALNEGVTIYDADGAIVGCNARAEELLGLAEAQLLGRTPADPRWQAVAEDGTRLGPGESPPERTLRTGRAYRNETIGIRTPSGDLRWLIVSSAPLHDAGGRLNGVVASFVDITGRRSRERALAAAEARFRTLFDKAPIGMCLTDLHGRLVMVNRALGDMLGRTAGSLLGTPMTSVVHPLDAAASRERFARLLAGAQESYRVEERHVDALAHERWMQVDATVLRDGDGAAQHVLMQVQDVSERRRHQAELEHMADHDALTGLLNRRGFEREVERHVAHTRRYGGGGALLLIDLDHFKHVNDSLGHRAGDDIIVEVAGVLRDRVRVTDVVARLGGDEFAVLLPRGGGAEASAVASSLLEALRSRPPVDAAGGVQITASIGIAPFDGGAGADETMVCADLAMYDAKEAGRDRSVAHGSSGAGTGVAARLAVLGRIRRALDGDGLRLLAQPIARTEDGTTEMYELLLRLAGENGELVAPAAFLDVAERFDLVQEIDRWVVARACELLGRARAAGRPLALSVNVSARSLAAGLSEFIEIQLDRTGADPHALVLELTESSAVANVDHARAFGERVRDLGCRLAIDDFGAGFGSFSYLKHLPFDFLKIDGEFVAGAPHNRADELIVDAVRDLAHGLDRRVVAEFVADAPLHDWLRGRGVDLVQGFHVGRPRPVEEILPAPARPRARA